MLVSVGVQMSDPVRFDKIEKLIIVSAPLNEISIQELANAVAEEAALIWNMSDDPAGSYEGKKSLPTGEVTPITLTLDGWKVTFDNDPSDDLRILLITNGFLRSKDGTDPIIDPKGGFVQNLSARSEKFKILGSGRQLQYDHKRWKSLSRESPHSLCFFDKDKFKTLNREHTEATVDKLILRPYQQLLWNQHRLTYSVGGDEFVAFFPGDSAIVSRGKAELIRRMTEEQVFKIKDAEVRFTISMGVVQAKDGESLEQLEERAAPSPAADKQRDCE